MSTRSSSLIPLASVIIDSPSARKSSPALSDEHRLMKLTKSLYQADQQVKYLHLQAEVESLLLHLQVLKQQKLTYWVQSETRNYKQ